MNHPPASTIGFDTPPDRHPAVSVVLFLVVVALAASIAVGFKELGLAVVEWYSDTDDATRAAAHLPAVATFAAVTGTVLVAIALGWAAARRWPGQAGLEAIAATASGDDRRISLRATLIRASGTWLMLAGLAPIGREAAILETGGAIGSTLGRRFGGRGAALAAAGAAAAFATAYHAPLAAIIYIEEHLRVRGSRRALTFVVGGAAGGFLLATKAYGTEAILPEVTAGWSRLAVAAAVAVVPATLAARLFLEARNRVARARDRRVHSTAQRIGVAVGAAAVAGVVVARYPLTAGNGMDALRHVAPSVVVIGAVTLALALGKAVGGVAVVGGGAPGGVLTPTIVVGAGAASAVALAGHRLGWGTPHVWALVVLAGSAAVAVGLRAPITAALLLPEMTGDYALVPACAAVVVVAIALDRCLDACLHRLGEHLPTGVRDEDG
jgi:CIC family chloride channel protein